MSTSHICRCHVCGKVNEQEHGKVIKCSHCHKPLGTFYYFDDRLTAIYSDQSLRPVFAEMEVRPIYGLTAYWET